MGGGIFETSDIFAAGAPAPAERFAGYPRYNFTGGHNAPEMIPAEGLAIALARALDRDGEKLAYYNLGQGGLGYLPLRETVAEKLRSRRGIASTADEVLITSGSGPAIDLVNRLLIAPGDTVLIESFSYTASINKARRAGAEVIGVPLDRGGIVIEELARILADLHAKGKRPKYIYTIPTVQNPTGSILGLERRRALVALAREYAVPIFEDECYADLTWTQNAPPALRSLAPEETIHIGSFSKNLAPALRLGYVSAPWPVLSRMLGGKTDGGTGALDQMAAAEYFGFYFAQHVGRLVAGLGRKRSAMVAAVEREFGALVDVWQPEGGIFVWLEFPGDIDTATVLPAAATRGVAFNAGAEWACDPADGRNFLRLCFASPSVTDIAEGVAELAQAFFETTGRPERGANVRRG